MNSELAKVKARIKALAAKTVEAGCSEHEALHAAEMVGRLLDQYNLSMDEIDIREEICVLSEVPAGSRRRMDRVRDGGITSDGVDGHARALEHAGGGEPL